jgi:phage/plasmid-associated DNA primase
MTGEDMQDAEVKGKQKRLTFRNVAKLFVLGNEFPKVIDTSLAFEDRTLILKFPNEFKGKNQIDNIEHTWLSDKDQVSGIFNWMLEGLHRLLRNGCFTISSTTQEIMQEFKRLSDPIGAWIEDNCILDPEGFVSRKDAFENYKTYVDQELGKAPDTERRFYQRLRDMPKIKDHKTKTGARGFKGISLRAGGDATASGQRTLETAEVAETAHILVPKTECSEAQNENCQTEKCAATAASAATKENSADQKAKKVLRVLPSHGEPCEGTTSAGGSCGYASEHYLIGAEGKKTAWCKTHLKNILSAYDTTNYTIQYGTENKNNCNLEPD